jgi:2-haloacid dehalogenase
MAPPVFVFDAYGTLFDLGAAIARHRDAIGPEADRLAEIWRIKQLEYSWTLTLAGRYVEFWILTERALDYALARLPSIDRRLKSQLLDAYLVLDAYADARATIEQLKVQNLRTGILSNGSPFMLARAVAAAGLGPALDAVLSVHSVRAYKPRPEVYALVTQAFKVTSAEVIFVSSNRWDVMGAASFGFRPVWINRSNSPDEYLEAAPFTSLKDLTGLLSLARS